MILHLNNKAQIFNYWEYIITLIQHNQLKAMK